MKFKLLLLLFTAVCGGVSGNGFPCDPVDFGHGSVVCRCNATYCDTLEPLQELGNRGFYKLTSNQDGLRFSESNGTIYDDITGVPDVIVHLNRSQKFQKIIGFGGAFTDAATINIKKLSEPLQKKIIETYYGKDGLEYNIGRVNMGGCDFSTRTYTYLDQEGDTEMTSFALAEEDTDYKIPMIHEALKLKPDMKLFASPWTAPKWMKTNNDYIGYGFLKTEHYQLWANYFLRFLEEYDKRNVSFWAVTAQNEPLDGTLPNFPFNCMGWYPEQQRDWIKYNLGPSIRASRFNQTKIIMFDDQRPLLATWTRTILEDPEAAKYISGIGIHWYWDFFPTTNLDLTARDYPDVFMIGTEACTGAPPEPTPVILGSWLRGYQYISDILEDLNHHVAGWTDWNLVLDMEGGPNWEGNTVDAPIIADIELDVVYKQPMYYALGHVSKFVPEGSVRILWESQELKGLLFLAVERPDNKTVCIVLNPTETRVSLAISDPDAGVIETNIGPNSWHTIVYD